MSNLAEIRDRVEVALMDTGNAIWDTGTIDEAIRTALDEYSQVLPLEWETVITLPGDGREIALDSLTGLIQVREVWWPYNSTLTTEPWPPNKVKGFRLWWDDARPVLFLDMVTGAQPQTDDELRIWYTKRQEIENLDSATATSIRTDHESWIVTGAAGHAAMSHVIDSVDSSAADMYAVSLTGTWGKSKLRDFRTFLEQLRREQGRSGSNWGAGWQLDKWDGRAG